MTLNKTFNPFVSSVLPVFHVIRIERTLQSLRSTVGIWLPASVVRQHARPLGQWEMVPIGVVTGILPVVILLVILEWTLMGGQAKQKITLKRDMSFYRTFMTKTTRMSY